MSSIWGTVIKVDDFFKKSPTTVYIKIGEESQPVFSLKEDRVYRVPFFQREIRWAKEQIIALVDDVKDGTKFLGNFIVTRDSKGDYDILDGQQRSTVILMLLYFAHCKYPDRIDLYDSCDFVVESFKGLKNLWDKQFANISDDDIELLNATDDYGQMQKYLDLWNFFDDLSVFQKPHDAIGFVKKLKDCEINLIVDTDGKKSIDVFLDVNLKGVKLDVEDIFKGYLCATGDSNEIHELWKNLKKHAKVVDEIQSDYQFITVLEHFFRCEIANDIRYKDIDFKADFTIKEAMEIEGTPFSMGEHLVKVINNKSWMKDALAKMDEVYSLIENISKNKSSCGVYSEYIDAYNSAHSKKKLDSDENEVIYNIIRKIMLDKNAIPKCLLVKYFSEVTIKAKQVSIEDIRKIYAVYVASVFFAIYETKKAGSKIYQIVQDQDWYSKIMQYISSCLQRDELSNRQVCVSYRLIDEEEVQKYRCKSLATIYNFLNITDSAVTTKNVKDMKKFLNDDDKFSFEHFLLNDSKTCRVKLETGEEFDYSYPAEIRKYIDSLFNFIFISQTNNDLLGNEYLVQKLNTIKSKKETFKDETCQYSMNVIKMVREYIKSPDVSGKSHEEAVNMLDSYYKGDFKSQYLQYSNAIIQLLTSKDG